MQTSQTVYSVPQKVIDDSRSFLYSVGLKGCEGTALWVGVHEGPNVKITRVFIPEQICTKTRFGVAVDLTPKAHYTLTDNLTGNERFFIRIHSHPGRAYHSPRDNENPILSHRGALSIVVPDFAKRPIVLADCAVYRLEQGHGWQALSSSEISQIFVVLK